MKILSLSGGGIRGILSARILLEIEKRLGGRIVDHFDMIVGTSTGSILAALLLTGKYSAKDCIDLYVKNAKRIFQKNIWDVDGLLGAKYSEYGIESCMQEYFGDTKVKDLLKDCLIPAYDTANRCARFFTKSDQDDVLVRDACRASSAAPTYFPNHGDYIDGGVFCNDPSMCAVSEAGGYQEGMILVSIGTGQKERPYHPTTHWGELQWISPVIDILMSASEDVCNYHLKKMFRNGGYFYLQPDLKSVSEAMDDVCHDNIQALLNKPMAFDYDSVVNKIKNN